MGAITPVDVDASHHPEVEIVDNGGGLKGVAWTLGAHVVSGNAAQLGLQFHDELAGGILVAVPPGEE